MSKSKIDEQRRAVARKLFEEADFETWTVASGGSAWEDDGEDRLVAPVFLEMPSGPSLKIQFGVEFEPGTAEPIEGQPEFDLPRNPANLYGYYINLDERGEFYADVRHASGQTIWEVRSDDDGEIDHVSAGYMKHARDIAGLEAHLRGMGVIGKDAELLSMEDFEAALPKRSDFETVPPKRSDFEEEEPVPGF